jgi:hypothetical protein
VSAPLELARTLLSLEGAIVEGTADRIEALLPPSLAESLGMAEHVSIREREGDGALGVGYGSPALERLLDAATRGASVASARAVLPAIRGQAAEAAAQAFVLRNGVFSPGAPRPLAAVRLWVHALWTAHSDETREGICEAAVSVATGSAIDGFTGAAVLGRAPPFQLSPGQAARALERALSACSARARLDASAFVEGAARRLARDRQRLDEYFADLLSELERRARRSAGSAVAEKREALERERASKLEALAARHVLRFRVAPVAAALVQAPAWAVPLAIKRRKGSRTLELEYDCVTRRIVPLACEACDGAAPRPAACDEALHLLCERCAPSAEGRIRCPACMR